MFDLNDRPVLHVLCLLGFCGGLVWAYLDRDWTMLTMIAGGFLAGHFSNRRVR